MRKIPKPILTLLLTNTTTDIIPVQLFQQENPGDISNVQTTWQADLTGVSFAIATISITFWPVSNPSAVETRSGTANSVTGVLNFLNSLGIGSFWLSQSGGSTFIKTASDTTVYGELTIGIGSTAIAYSQVSNSILRITINGVNIVISLAAPPPDISGSVPVNNGDLFDGAATGFGRGLTVISRTLKYFPFNTEILFTDHSGGLGIVFPQFIIDTNYNYSVTVGP